MKRLLINRYVATAASGRFRKIRRLLSIMIIPAAMVSAPGCSRKIYVPVESIKIQRDTVRTIRADRDSIVIKDSVTVASRNDTVFKESFRWRFRDRLVHDTLLKTRLDTVYIEKPLPAVSPSGKSAIASFGHRLSSALWNYPLSPLLLIAILFILHRLLRSRK